MPRKSRPIATTGPRWRTAPGLGSGSTALHDRPGDTGRERRDDTERERHDDRHVLRGRPSPVTDRTPHTPVEPADPPAEEPEIARPQKRFDDELPRIRPSEAPPTPSPEAQRAPGGQRAIARRTSLQDSFTRSVRSLEPISDLEAAAFAGRFAADFQSFDEDDPGLRATVLRPLLTDSQATTWGWSGRGRQRADCPLPGRLFRSSDTVLFVEVLVRVTTYARSRAASVPDVPTGEHVEPVGVVGPSSVPPEADPRWVAVEANWLRMTVPITRSPDDGRLVVDPLLVPEQTA